MSKEIKIGGVCERDLDLFLQEQLLSSPGFCKWFAKETLGLMGVSGVAERVERGATNDLGESDVEATFRQQDESLVTVYVENKIKAKFQDEQYERYLKKAKRAKASNQIDDYRIVLFAPQKYLDGNLQGFALPECHKIAYEDAMAYLNKEGSEVDIQLDHRLMYKSSLLGNAIDLMTLHSSGVPDQFWELYRDEVKRIAPEFKYEPKKLSHPDGYDTVEFKQSGLSRYNWLVKPEPVHRLRRGYFGEFGSSPHGEFYIKFPKCSKKERLMALKESFDPILEPHMIIVDASPSAAIRIAVPKVAWSYWDKDQIPALRTALYLGKNLYDWFLSDRVQAVWEEFLDSIQHE
jgi:cellobiose-specific phosphotransferase system component IIB